MSIKAKKPRGARWFIAIAIVFAGTALGYAAFTDGSTMSGDMQPQTAYANKFLNLCDGQQWFVDEIEEQLNHRQLSVYTISGREDLDRIVNLGKEGEGIKGELPRAVGELTELKRLFLAGNRLSGKIPESLYLLPKLENVDLTDNDYAGGVPEGFGTMPSLKILMLGMNAFTGSVPGEILSNKSLTVLDLSGNGLSGPVPAGLNDMTGLEYLAISDNPFDAGPIPDFSALSSLKTLSAWNCGFTGELPDGVYALSGLQILDLYGNALEGAPKPAFYDMNALEYVSFGANEMSGDFPADISKLTKLRIFDISDNEFRGTLPDGFAQNPELESLHLENNRLRGRVPASLKALYDGGTEVFLDGNHMTGPVLRDMPHNKDNFADGAASLQFRLTLPAAVTGALGNALNLHPYLYNRAASGAYATKPTLNPDEYDIAVTNDPKGKLSVVADATGLRVTASERVLLSENILITISVKDNDGSDYSRAVTIFTTEPLPSSGGAGGFSAPVAETDEEAREERDVHERYAEGYPGGKFAPESPVTREEVAKMIVIALGASWDGGALQKTYSDVDEGRWSAPYIKTAARLGCFEGYPDGTFKPSRPITRAEFVAVMVRASGAALAHGAKASELPFTDLRDAWYLPYLKEAFDGDLIEGYPDGTFGLDAPISRAEAVKTINLFIGRDPALEPTIPYMDNPFSDVEKSHWAYPHIIEASVTHEHTGVEEERDEE
ncbi:MAG: S-layer homology domain-containing protein [Clostridiales Family XIII bacterium]|jgi:hypothetical protein|nr:S-layer homology domain-containing protein [Clostridiales Family XIII bacterium]